MTRFFRRCSADLAYDDEGHGNPLVLLHAGVADRRGWRSQIDHFRATNRVVAYDRRGYGETRTEQGALYSHVDDLVGLLDELQIERCVLVGNSQGGRIAVDCALGHPTRIAGLVLIATAISGISVDEDDLDREELPIFVAIDKADERGDKDEVNRLEARLWLDGPRAPEGRVGGIERGLFLEMNGIALAHPYPHDEQEPPSAVDELRRITVPTLVLCGDLDVAHVISNCERAAAEICGARREILTGVAHLPQLEAPALVNRHIASFMPNVEW